jgi:hypothetical protein
MLHCCGRGKNNRFFVSKDVPSQSVFRLQDRRYWQKRLDKVKEDHTASLPPPLFGSKRSINAPQYHWMALKWKSYLEDSLKFKSSTWFSTTTHALDSHGARPVIHNSLFLNVFDLKAVENFLLELKGRGGTACVSLLYCQYSKASAT